MSLNRWTGLGNITKDPLTRYTPNGTAVCSFTVACNERYKDRDGNKKESVEYINIVAWGQLAEICGKYLQKGQQVYVEGKLTTRSYDDKDGNKRYITEIKADKVDTLGGSGSKNEQNIGQSQRSIGNQYQDSSNDKKMSHNQNSEQWPDDEIPF